MWSLINDNDDCRRILKQQTSYIDSEEEEESSMEIIGCPYCCDDGFDALGLCVHLEDQHQLQIKSGVCPLCVSNLEKYMIIQLESVLKIDKQFCRFLDEKDQGLCKRKPYDDESYSIISQLRRKLQEHSLSLHKESTSSTSSTDAATDSLLFSFIYNPPQSHEPKVDSSAEPSSSKTLQEDVTLQRSGSIISSVRFSRNDHEDRAQKSNFVQTVLLSTIFDDKLTTCNKTNNTMARPSPNSAWKTTKL